MPLDNIAGYLQTEKRFKGSANFWKRPSVHLRAPLKKWGKWGIDYFSTMIKKIEGFHDSALLHGIHTNQENHGFDIQ